MIALIKQHIQARGYPQVVVNQYQLTESLVLDIDTVDKIGRFTVWDDYSCLLEVMATDNGRYLLQRRQQRHSLSDLIADFEHFICAMASQHNKR